MKEKRITKFFLTCATLVTCITLGVNLCLQHTTKPVYPKTTKKTETNTYEVDQAFRSYDSLSDSLNDYANLLSWDLYSGTWKSNTTSYQDATAALTGLYATETSYADKLNALIEQYGLTVYDEPASTEEETSSEDNSDHVWNEYRGSYTTAAILAEDEAWLRFISQ